MKNKIKKTVYNSLREAINSGNELVMRVVHLHDKRQIRLVALKQSKNSYICFLRIIEHDCPSIIIPLFEGPFYSSFELRLRHTADFLIPLIGKE